MIEENTTREEANGLGKRVNLVEVLIGRHDERLQILQMEFTEQRRDTWEAIGELREQSLSLLIRLATILGGIVVFGFIITIATQLLT